MKRFACLLSFIVILATGCYYDKGDQIYPNTSNLSAGCDTTNVRYSVEIVGILSANCYTCHGGTASNGAGYKLDMYQVLKSMATSGQLVRAVTHTGPDFTQMPQGGSKLPECDIAKIRTWVRNGALNN